MRKNLENRLTTVVWVAFLGLAACTVQVKDENAGSGGATSTSTGAAGASTTGTTVGAGGAGSTAGAAGQAGSSVTKDGGSAGSGMSLNDASLPSYKDASWDSAEGSACINDSIDGGEMANPDLCGKLSVPAAGSACYDLGSEGKALCDLMRQKARPGAFRAFFNCIDTQTKSDACASVDVCLDAKWPTGCQVGKVLISNGKQWDCTNLVSKCPATDGGPDGFSLAECDFIMNVFNDQARTQIYNCYLSSPGASDPTTCKSDFTDCVYTP